MQFSSGQPPGTLRFDSRDNLLQALQEGLEATIGPSVESLLVALEAYRAAGGEGLIFVNDDGLQLLDKIERHALLQPAAVSPGHRHARVWFRCEAKQRAASPAGFLSTCMYDKSMSSAR